MLNRKPVAMETFFANIDANLKVYWCIASGASIIFIIEAIITFIRPGSGSAEASQDNASEKAELPLRLLSFRTLFHFLLGFGWTGVLLYDEIESRLIVAAIASLVGIAFIILLYFATRSLMKPDKGLSFSITEAGVNTGEVYTAIPPNREGKGRVLVNVKGAARELQAITFGDERIEAGKFVTIVGVENSILIVEPL